MDKEQIKAVLEAVSESLRGLLPETPQPTAAAEVDYGYDGKKKVIPARCVAPNIVLYFIFTHCLTINNGACPEWAFCDGNNNLPQRGRA